MKTKFLGMVGAAALLIASLGSASAAIVVDLGALAANDAADLHINNVSASATPFDIVYKFSLSNNGELTNATFLGLPFGHVNDNNRTIQNFSLTLHDGAYSPPSIGTTLATGVNNNVAGQVNYTIPDTLLNAGSYYIEAIGLFAPTFSRGSNSGQIDTSAKFSVNGGLTVTAVPEASTWAMMFLGFAALGFAGYRSRRSSLGSA